MKRVVNIAFVAGGVVMSGYAFGVNVNEGLWEITSRMDMPGMAFSMPTVTYSQCITEQSLIPEKREGSEECKVESHDENSDSVYWRVICRTDAGNMTGNGAITYRGDEFTGQMTMDISGPDGPMQMKNSLQGRRIGDCR